ncbi:MAG: hypothetical protein HY080_05635 [Gammaproteobacteria bacterium]|nr:hypothetical protein [Gammaproteobacteria bacterium]
MEKKKKIVKYTTEELKKMKGSTHWAWLIHEEKNPNKKIQPTHKPRG